MRDVPTVSAAAAAAMRSGHTSQVCLPHNGRAWQITAPIANAMLNACPLGRLRPLSSIITCTRSAEGRGLPISVFSAGIASIVAASTGIVIAYARCPRKYSAAATTIISPAAGSESPAADAARITPSSPPACSCSHTLAVRSPGRRSVTTAAVLSAAAIATHPRNAALRLLRLHPASATPPPALPAF